MKQVFSAHRGARAVLNLCLLAACASAFAEVTSIADWPCATWTERRTSGAQVDAPQMWLSGYLTGLASASRVDALAITDAPRVFEWMDEYCAAYPDAAISTGALVLFHDLSGRLPRGPARAL